VTSTPVAGTQSGTYSGTIAAVGASDSYTFAPTVSGPAVVGTCGVDTGSYFTLAVYRSGQLLASGTNANYCNWTSLSVSAGQVYTVTTTAHTGVTGIYRSSWSVNGAPVVWTASGTLSATSGSSATHVASAAHPLAVLAGRPLHELRSRVSAAVAQTTAPSSQTMSVPSLGNGPITIAACGPSGTIYDTNLLAANGNLLASASASSNCQTLSYTPAARGLFRMQEVAISGSGNWSGTITTN
jgi:hypothetical protein